ncbi:MAG TPA: M14 family zinc carboxypeptidase [Gemmatimonadaceae bacterium]|nr:M14 family zinc carboxypeptidase [Gemmatimonadaceae bacterium]
MADTMKETPMYKAYVATTTTLPLGTLLMIVATACTTTRSAVPAVSGAAPPAVNTSTPCCDRGAFSAGLRIAERYRNPAITERRFTHQRFWSAVDASVKAATLKVETLGQSVLGRDIRSVTFGSGAARVLLWSQMHGDEATATMALADIFGFLADTVRSDLRDRLTRELTIVFVPMLNPDGAELFQRQNAMGIDVNRDARRLVTPEARALKSVHERFKPHFGFNLHDQSARTRAGSRGPASAIALLPPAYDEAKSYNDVRRRARLVAATLATMFAYEIPGRVAKYDDTYEPRAFGDLMQQWGTSTVLIESGAMPNDPEKQRLRALNVAAILAVLDAIATGAYERAEISAYESLPFNAGGASDLLLRNAQLVLPGKPPMRVDIAINYEDALAKADGRVRDVGDLDAVIAIDTVDLSGLFLHPSPRALTTTPAGPMLRIGAPAVFEVRRGESPSSELVRRIGSN